MTSSSNEAQPKTSRFVFIDALRGIACLSVFIHHLYHGHPFEQTLGRYSPHFLNLLSEFGAYGVQIFFVLSGFVIAHSLRATPISASGVGRFILRRQLRLDPPYWVMLALGLSLLMIDAHVPGQRAADLPTLKEVFYNIFYLQDIVKAKPILGVAWTLCVEVQFYLAFIAILILSTILNPSPPTSEEISDKNNSHSPSKVLVALLGLSGAASLGVICVTRVPTVFIQYWYLFVAGVLGCWGLSAATARPAFRAFMTLFAITIFIAWLDSGKHLKAPFQSMAVGWFTMASIWLVGQRSELEKRYLSGFLQYAGRISYSFYLVHLPISWGILRIGFKISGPNIFAAIVWIAVAAMASFALAHLFFMYIERPSMNFASRFKLPARAFEAVEVEKVHQDR